MNKMNKLKVTINKSAETTVNYRDIAPGTVYRCCGSIVLKLIGQEAVILTHAGSDSALWLDLARGYKDRTDNVIMGKLTGITIDK